jgi:hypothetical protein
VASDKWRRHVAAIEEENPAIAKSINVIETMSKGVAIWRLWHISGNGSGKRRGEKS